MSRKVQAVELSSYNDLFGIEEIEKDQIVQMELDKLYDSPNNPFKVQDDDQMLKMVESIKQYGVIVPGLVRPGDGGKYEIIAGHRRKRGSVLANKTTMPVIVRDMTDDEAAIIIVDTNIQRENLLFSEKAYAYKLKMEAMRHQGIKSEEQITASLVGEPAGESARQVQRYIRLTELLEMVDKKKLNFIAAVEISYLKKEEQEWLLQYLKSNMGAPGTQQAQELKKWSKEGKLSKELIESILSQNRAASKVSFKAERIRKYFPPDYTKETMEQVILQLLEQWSHDNNIT